MQRVRLSSEQAPVHKLGDSQMKLSPKFRLATRQPRSDRPSEPLIPGLPDDVSLNCLLRLPVESHPRCRSVCKRWHSLMATKERFFTLRSECGLSGPWLFVFAHRWCAGGRTRWHVLDLDHFTWHDIPPMPWRGGCPRALRCVPLPSEGSLVVCGGGAAALKFEMRRNRWTAMGRMAAAARSYFAGGVVEGKVYAAGGIGADLAELDSAEVLDPRRGVWSPVAGMGTGTGMGAYDAAVLGGKLLVTEGWVWPFCVSPRGRVYDPKAGLWEGMAAGLREGWTGSSAVVLGRLVVVSELERMRLKVYHEGDDSWDPVEGPPLPERICKPFAVGACGSRVYVVGRGLQVAVGRVSRLGKKGFAVEWTVVEAPDRFSDLTPSSSLVLFG